MLRTSEEYLDSQARLTINLPTSLHLVIKAHAALDNTTIREFVLDAIKLKIDDEDKSDRKLNDKTKAILKKSLDNKEKRQSFKSVDSLMRSMSASVQKQSKRMKA